MLGFDSQQAASVNDKDNSANREVNDRHSKSHVIFLIAVSHVGSTYFQAEKHDVKHILGQRGQMFETNRETLTHS